MTFSEAAISSLHVSSKPNNEAIAAMGGTAGQLSNGLWQARGDEFSVEKADFGYMAWGILGPWDHTWGILGPYLGPWGMNHLGP